MKSILRVPSFAKINWNLKILGQRSDGYHELRTIYQTIDLRDQIAFEASTGEGIDLDIRGRRVAEGEDNLLYRTAVLLRQAAGRRRGVKMSLHKRIPVGAGLGGGSSNSAVALMALNRLWGCHLTQEQLGRLAAQLGSDVPFFLTGGTALGVGRGEKVLPLPDVFEDEGLLLLYPGLEIATGEAYSLGNWEACEEDPCILTKQALDTTMRRLHGAADQTIDEWSLLENDFEEPLFRRYPILAETQKSLMEAGCKRVMLCGSGSTLLGVGGIEKVKDLCKEIKNRGEVFFCHTLSRKAYQGAVNESGHLF